MVCAAWGWFSRSRPPEGACKESTSDFWPRIAQLGLVEARFCGEKPWPDVESRTSAWHGMVCFFYFAIVVVTFSTVVHQLRRKPTNLVAGPSIYFRRR